MINKYEHNPTPSHPTNICIKLSAVTNTIINHVNNDKYDINRGKCGSSLIYSVEYMCTNIDILVITTNIIAVNPSNCNPIPVITHDHSFTYVSDLFNTTSLKIYSAVNHVMTICNTVNFATPSLPILRPITPATNALTNGNHIIITYINARRDLNPRLIT